MDFPSGADKECPWAVYRSARIRSTGSDVIAAVTNRLEKKLFLPAAIAASCLWILVIQYEKNELYIQSILILGCFGYFLCQFGHKQRKLRRNVQTVTNFEVNWKWWKEKRRNCPKITKFCVFLDINKRNTKKCPNDTEFRRCFGHFLAETVLLKQNPRFCFVRYYLMRKKTGLSFPDSPGYIRSLSSWNPHRY